MRKGVPSPFRELIGSGGNPGSGIWEIFLLLSRNYTPKRGSCEWRPVFSVMQQWEGKRVDIRSQEGCVTTKCLPFLSTTQGYP